jgi:hypothetical protein
MIRVHAAQNPQHIRALPDGFIRLLRRRATGEAQFSIQLLGNFADPRQST